jgi:hypothetical protein
MIFDFCGTFATKFVNSGKNKQRRQMSCGHHGIFFIFGALANGIEKNLICGAESIKF